MVLNKNYIRAFYIHTPDNYIHQMYDGRQKEAQRMSSR